jgi:lysophospholipase L1-like esterase
VLATVVPVTRGHAAAEPGRAEAVWAFNDWLRELAEASGVPLLDLEAALRCSTADRHLDEQLASPDGLHLRRAAYRTRLDPLILPLLLRTFASPVPGAAVAR